MICIYAYICVQVYIYLYMHIYVCMYSIYLSHTDKAICPNDNSHRYSFPQLLIMAACLYQLSHVIFPRCARGVSQLGSCLFPNLLYSNYTWPMTLLKGLGKLKTTGHCSWWSSVWPSSRKTPHQYSERSVRQFCEKCVALKWSSDSRRLGRLDNFEV